MLPLCRYLLYLYPQAHRLEFGEEMMAVVCEREEESRSAGAVARWRFSAREIVGLLHGALQEQLRGMTGCHVWEVIPMRRFSMGN